MEFEVSNNIEFVVIINFTRRKLVSVVERRAKRSI